MTVRKAISKTLRFEVLKRDSFTCQYCGATAPDVLLEIDHVIPVASGGPTDILNLVTACTECNRGKRDRKLSDTSAVKKQRARLEEQQAKIEQLEMLVQWQRDLAELNQHELAVVVNFWLELVHPYRLTFTAIEQLRKMLHTYSVQEVLEAMHASVRAYARFDKDDLVMTPESVETAWQKVGAICATRRRERDNPWLKDVYYIRKILTNRFGGNVDPIKSMAFIQECLELGVNPDTLTLLAKTARHWPHFKHACAAVLESM